LSIAASCLTSSCFAQQQDDIRSSAFAQVKIAPSLFEGQSGATETEKKEQQDETNGVKPAAPPVPRSKEQPKRILGVMPNYRAVSAGAIPPPPTLKESFNIATENSFDYSSFVFTGITSAIADAEGAHRDLGGGVGGYWAYYWRGFVDKTDGNYLVIFALPTVFRQDERYYAMGQGPKGKRVLYAATRVLITPDYHGHNSFNASELLGRAIAQGVSTTYYPAADRTASEILSKWAYAVMRDSLTNVFREFWPDIATHVLHRHP
jgi:hypothetical protein